MNPVTKIIHVTSGPQFVEDLQTINDERKKKRHYNHKFLKVSTFFWFESLLTNISNQNNIGNYLSDC